MNRIAFAWHGLPDYAARCIRASIESIDAHIAVVATSPNVPIEGMECSLGQSVNWVDGEDEHTNWENLGLAPPEVLFVSGYRTLAFNCLSRQVRQMGGRVILMSDHNWRGSTRQRFVDPLRHRLLLRGRFDGIFVPGESGVRVARSWGYAREDIAKGLYGADSKLFNGGVSLGMRPKTLLFVGQFVPRKNILGLTNAFLQFSQAHPEWQLEICGSGPQQPAIPTHPRIRVNGFVQPWKLADLFRSVRCLVLPSIEENWGLVVHEAALSGCALALSEAVGAGDDLARPENSVVYPAADEAAITGALHQIALWDDDKWTSAERASRERARLFGPEVFSDGVKSLVARLKSRTPGQ